MTLPPRDPASQQRADRRDVLRPALDAAQRFYAGALDQCGTALEYLAKCEGPFVVTATQSTRRMGVLAVDSAIAVANGETVPERQVSEAVLTTCDNAAEFVANHP